MAVFALNLLWLGPLAIGFLSLFLGRRALWGLVVGSGFGHLLLWGYLYLTYHAQGPVQVLPWFSLGGKPLFYAIGLSPQNAWLVFLAIFLGHAALFYAVAQIARPRAFSFLVFLVMAFSQGVFLARDVVLFFVFYEASLVPAFLLIYGWGGRQRRAAAVKFALFTLGGSVVLLIGLLWGLMGRASGLWEEWRGMALPMGAWWLMTIGLAVKLPLIPLHNWLGEAHVEADTPVSILLAGLLLKLGGYALLSWVWINGPSGLLVGWGGLSLVYAAAVATAQKDLKKLIAFTSIGHMALVAIGAGAGSSTALQGAYHQLFTHGLVSAALFAWVGYIEKATGSRHIGYLRGVLKGVGFQQLLPVVLFFAAIGVPGTALFVSEVLVVLGTGAGIGWTWAWVPALSLPLTGIYFLRAYRELAQPTPEQVPLPEAHLFAPQLAVIGVLLLGILLAGIFPRPWLTVLSYVGP
ncbi:MAG: NAD(P)H-quinone oxidoreductase subunit D4 [Bacteroidia bacterium]|jgi:proton-translocating NADH-quinone oxidoreductase chain M|nr:MAG: NAD(P)H-quinone oxidoreductase subunit D4 [Bacteroidia bacterium]